jgi:hypothetical protein
MNGKGRVERFVANGLSRWLGLLAKALLPVGLFAVSIVSATAHRAEAAPAPAPSIAVAATSVFGAASARGVGRAFAPTHDARGKSPATAASTNDHSIVEQES